MAAISALEALVMIGDRVILNNILTVMRVTNDHGIMATLLRAAILELEVPQAGAFFSIVALVFLGFIEFFSLLFLFFFFFSFLFFLLSERKLPQPYIESVFSLVLSLISNRPGGTAVVASNVLFLLLPLLKNTHLENQKVSAFLPSFLLAGFLSQTFPRNSDCNPCYPRDGYPSL